LPGGPSHKHKRTKERKGDEDEDEWRIVELEWKKLEAEWTGNGNVEKWKWSELNEPVGCEKRMREAALEKCMGRIGMELMELEWN
jgi:hypothetical protein